MSFFLGRATNGDALWKGIHLCQTKEGTSWHPFELTPAQIKCWLNRRSTSMRVQSSIDRIDAHESSAKAAWKQCDNCMEAVCVPLTNAMVWKPCIYSKARDPFYRAASSMRNCSAWTCLSQRNPITWSSRRMSTRNECLFTSPRLTLLTIRIQRYDLTDLCSPVRGRGVYFWSSGTEDWRRR